MLKECEFDDRTMIMYPCLLYRRGTDPDIREFLCSLSQVVGDVFNGNAVAGVFVVSLLLSLLLPKSKKRRNRHKEAYLWHI